MDITTYVQQFITTNRLTGGVSEEWFKILNQKVKSKFKDTAISVPTPSRLRKIVDKIVASY